jgi:hypothetical protein
MASHTMSRRRIRPSLFPNFPPFLTFIAPSDTYEDGEDPVEELCLNYFVAAGTSPLVLESLHKFGFKIKQVF